VATREAGQEIIIMLGYLLRNVKDVEPESAVEIEVWLD
jgi:hypothetical protein